MIEKRTDRKPEACGAHLKQSIELDIYYFVLGDPEAYGAHLKQSIELERDTIYTHLHYNELY